MNTYTEPEFLAVAETLGYRRVNQSSRMGGTALAATDGGVVFVRDWEKCATPDDVERLLACYRSLERKNRAAAALGRMGGASTSPAKRAASRANGAKGGRPVWRVVDRWDVDDDGAEDLLLCDERGRQLLLARRHERGSADPATWCAAFECGRGVDVRATAARVGEHIRSLADAFGVRDWPAEQVARLADLALARQAYEQSCAADADGRPQTFVRDGEVVVAWGEGSAKRLDVQTIVYRTLKAFDAVGWTVSAGAIRHNLGAWRADLKSGFRDESSGVHLFTPCGCNPFKLTASRLRPEWADWQTTYTA